MLKIAVCDDEDYICNEIYNHILKFSIEKNHDFKTEIFHSCEELIEEYFKGNRFDVIFLDVDFTKNKKSAMSGVELGRRIRKICNNDNEIIIYVTSFKEYAVASMKAKPFDYVQKPVNYSKLSEVLENCIDECIRNKKTFKFICAKSEKSVLISSIRYFESKGRTITLHTLYNDYVFYGKLADIMVMDGFKDFIGIHRTYFVNTSYVENFTVNKVVMSGEPKVELPISRRRSAELSRFLLSL